MDTANCHDVCRNERSRLLELASAGDARGFADATARLLTLAPHDEPAIRQLAGRLALLALFPACRVDVEAWVPSIDQPLEILAAVCASPLKLRHVIAAAQASHPRRDDHQNRVMGPTNRRRAAAAGWPPGQDRASSTRARRGDNYSLKF